MDIKETQVLDSSKFKQEHLEDLSRFLARHHAALVVLNGPRKGAEYPIRQSKFSLGRGEDADLRFDDSSMSRLHAEIEFSKGSFVLRDLKSANGILINNETVESHRLENGSRFELGRHRFQFVCVQREPTGQTHVIELDE